ncbi:MAG: DUF2306 domain-containing protein [Caulobacterales bacterium]|nr:DUF2306 domain-containing protein [Caulobacterales bacterium]
MTSQASSSRPGVLKTFAFGVLLLLAFVVCAASARFFLPEPPMAQAMQNHLDHRPIVFLIHVSGGIAALMLGAFQFVTRTGPRRAWHTAAGRFYVMACWLGAVSGLVIAQTSFAGPVATVGFSGLAVAWFVATAMGLRAILAGQIVSHRHWMVRSYALTLAAVTLRLMLPMPPLMGLDFTQGYRAISFLCWIPNLILAEVWLARTARQSTPGVPQRERAGPLA